MRYRLSCHFFLSLNITIFFPFCFVFVVSVFNLFFEEFIFDLLLFVNMPQFVRVCHVGHIHYIRSKILFKA